MTPLLDSLWFESHQLLLLRMLETSYGRDLFCIPQDFKTIVKIEPSKIHGLLGCEGVKAKIVARCYIGNIFGNLIRHRWVEFSRYAKFFYDNGGKTNIWLDNQWQLACTTETFYPEPEVPTVAGDGDVGTTNKASWNLARDAVNGDALDKSSNGISISAEWLGVGFRYRVFRGLLNFNTASLPFVDSATLKAYTTTWTDDYGDETIEIVKSTQVDPVSLVLLDFDNIIFTSISSIAFSDQTSTGYTDFPISDLTAININGVTKLAAITGRDLSDTAPNVQGNRIFTSFRSSENIVAIASYLEVIYDVPLPIGEPTPLFLSQFEHLLPKSKAWRI